MPSRTSRSGEPGTARLYGGATSPTAGGLPGSGPRGLASDSANAALGSQHLFVVVDRVDHHHLEQVLEVTREELHQRLTQLRPRVARSGFERGDVVLRDPEPARKLTLGQVMLVAHRPQTDGSHLDIHTDKYTHL